MFRVLVHLVVALCCLKASLGQSWQKGGGGGGTKGGHMAAFNQTTYVEDHPVGTMGMANLHRGNESRSALDRFMNKTRGAIPKGVCFDEVPTISLVRPQNGQIPAGNGSDPSLSRVQVCCKGYERNVHNFRKCDPICTEPCYNGLCVAPNTCACYPDFVNNHQGRCVPTCPIGCDNGECNLELNVCMCKDGFELDETHKFCVPRCDGGCGAGRCVAAGKCECYAGYTTDEDGKCVPKCEPDCGSGVCVAPGVCQCKPGYEKTETGCEPICSDGCFNGVCSAPETCTCKPGYKMGPSGNKCDATCERPCLNGVCTGPNTCSCHPGYILDEINVFKCLPHCPNGCPNGMCSGPNMCLCNAGFIKDRSLKGSQACVRRV